MKDNYDRRYAFRRPSSELRIQLRKCQTHYRDVRSTTYIRHWTSIL